jgi:hypothetical protein
MADFRTYCGRTPPARCRAWVGQGPDGRILGIGGAVYLSSGVRVFLEASAEARRFPVALHKAARMVLSHLARSGVPAVTLVVDRRWPQAEAWARRLGFGADKDGSDIWVWRPSRRCVGAGRDAAGNRADAASAPTAKDAWRRHATDSDSERRR